MRRKPVNSILLWPLLQFLPDFLRWWSVMWNCELTQTLSSPCCFWSWYIMEAIETLTKISKAKEPTKRDSAFLFNLLACAFWLGSWHHWYSELSWKGVPIPVILLILWCLLCSWFSSAEQMSYLPLVSVATWTHSSFSSILGTPSHILCRVGLVDTNCYSVLFLWKVFLRPFIMMDGVAR